ncbi:MAG TPA: FHA domain-containing protein [Kofleriaceae bacterium]|nr:FHA domain-containing protein [Kofleriaceae bacterium]
MTATSTNADPAANAWEINDPVLRLRLFGTERLFELSSSDRWVIGSSAECSIRLDDPSGRVSRRHAELQRDHDVWSVHDLKSTNGIRQNRDDRETFQLAPGDEIGLGGVTLIAESRRSIALHQMLRRLLGWSIARLAEVDRAFREVREMAHVRAALILRGEGSLAGVARRLHQLTLPERPFVMLAADESATQALDRAANGMLYAEARDLPRDLRPLVAGLRDPEVRIRFVVCADRTEAAELAAMMPRIATIWIPPVAERKDELDQLLEAYGRDAVAALGAHDLGFRPHDLKWIRGGGIRTLDEIEEVTYRLVALRNWGVTAGAERLGITHGALSRWARRRKIPT